METTRDLESTTGTPDTPEVRRLLESSQSALAPRPIDKIVDELLEYSKIHGLGGSRDSISSPDAFSANPPRWRSGGETPRERMLIAQATDSSR